MQESLFRIILRLRNRHLLAFDVGVLLIAPFLALTARLEDVFELLKYSDSVHILLISTIPLKLAVFFHYGFYKRYWRLASVQELKVMVQGSIVAFVAGGAVFILLHSTVEPFDLPRSYPFLEGVIVIAGTTGIRLLMRLLYDKSVRVPWTNADKRILIVGAGVAGSMIVKEIGQHGNMGVYPIGFLDDDPYKQEMVIHNIPVLGTIKDLPHIVKQHGIDEVVIAIPTASGKTIRRVVELCTQARVPSKTVPALFEIIDGKTSINELRKVQIEDLLRRTVVQINTLSVEALLSGNRVLVTGAGGSIGGELCRQINRFNPAEIILLGHGENSIFQVAAELRKRAEAGGAYPQIKTVIADIRDHERMEHVFQECRPHIVFHAAAHKHVGLMEANMVEAVTNNVHGTKTVAELSEQFGVHRFVMISSDKAVNPTSVMGVTKRIAELLVRDVAQQTGHIFTAVRFGNVLGSRGSVIPIFQRQLASGGPITVSHPDATRFFMTIPEAVQLVLQASALAAGGEVFVLDMGEPVSIKSMAEDFIRLSGYEVDKDIEIVFTGLQAGEKMHEELAYEFEDVTRSRHEKILICRENGYSNAHWEWIGKTLNLPMPVNSVDQHRAIRREVISKLIDAARKEEEAGLEGMIRQIVPQFHRTEFIPPSQRETVSRKHLPEVKAAPVISEQQL